MDQAYSNEYANVHRGLHLLSDAETEAYEKVREAVRRFINAKSTLGANCLHLAGTTSAINLVARSWGDVESRGWRRGSADPRMEHHSNIVPWHLSWRARTGCKVRSSRPITDQGQLRLDLLDELSHAARTRLVAVTAVPRTCWARSIRLPTSHRSSARGRGGAVLVDGRSERAPHMTTDVQALGCDFLAFSGHKMLGAVRHRNTLRPRGAAARRHAAVHGRRRHDRGGDGGRQSPTTIRRIASRPARRRSSRRSGLGAALDYMEKVGRERIAAHEADLKTYAHERLRADQLAAHLRRRARQGRHRLLRAAGHPRA